LSIGIWINRSLTLHFRRIDGFLSAIEEKNESDHEFYSHYAAFRKISKTKDTRFSRFPRVYNFLISHGSHHAYSTPLYIGYGALSVVNTIIFLMIELGKISFDGFTSALLFGPFIFNMLFTAYAWSETETEKSIDPSMKYKGIWEIALKGNIERNNNNIIVFLDRDGTINENRDEGVLRKRDLHFVSRLLPSLKLLSMINARVALVTDQPYFRDNVSGLKPIDDKLRKMFIVTAGIKEKNFRIYNCTEEDCMKPNPSNLVRALNDFNLRDVKGIKIYYIGDKCIDMKTAKNLESVLGNDQKITKIRLNWKYGDKKERSDCNIDDFIEKKSLLEAVFLVLEDM